MVDNASPPPTHTQMAHLLQAKGFRDVYNIVGGIDAYSKEVDPSVPVY